MGRFRARDATLASKVYRGCRVASWISGLDYLPGNVIPDPPVLIERVTSTSSSRRSMKKLPCALIIPPKFGVRLLENMGDDLGVSRYTDKSALV